MSCAKYKRVLIKVSGEALAGDKHFGLDIPTVDAVAAEIARCVRAGVEVAVVTGGGNYWRGLKDGGPMERTRADNIGMLATVMNCLALSESLERCGIETRVQTAVEMREIADLYTRRDADRELKAGRVVLLGCGTGNPFFSTDTGAVLRGTEIRVSTIVCTADGESADQVDIAAKNCPQLVNKLIVGGEREGWRNFDEEYTLFSSHYKRTQDAPGGDDLMLMFFTSGTTGYPKIAAHNYKYPLGHFHTAKYWHNVDPDGLHFTISDTGWAKSMWGKLYGQWLCEAATFVYDFDRFDAADIMPMFAKHKITTFCAPPTMLRMMIKEDLSKYDFSSVRHMTTAGEALNPEVYRQFEKATGLQIIEGFGQTESTMIIGNMVGASHKIGSMGKPAPIYNVELVNENGEPVAVGETGEIVINLKDGHPCGLFTGYYGDEEKTKEVMHDGYYHTGDTAWRDEDGFFWYVGRVDDVIKSSGYRIGPFEIESVIMELPYVLECGVSAEPDEVRGQVVKASIVLVKGTEGTEELKKEIQQYVKKNTAPYKYPRIVVFKDELPKTVSGKIQRNKL